MNHTPPSGETVAVFPIPNTVAFPGTQMPLHVFEPRYRLMVEQCLKEKLYLGIAHTQSKEKKSSKYGRANLAQKKQFRNFGYHEPHRIFSAGPCEVLKHLDEGSLLINVDLKQRYKTLKTLQEVPFRIVEALPYMDLEPDEKDQIQAKSHCDQIVVHLLNLVANHMQNDAVMLKQVNDLKRMSPEIFSFRVFQFVQLQPELMQLNLENQNPLERIELIWSFLKEIK